jgi:hypothetical protein
MNVHVIYGVVRFRNEIIFGKKEKMDIIFSSKEGLISFCIPISPSNTVIGALDKKGTH